MSVPAVIRPLSPRERLFVEEYVIDWNGTQAAIRAGFSPRTAYAIASELLRRPQVASAIAALLGERVDRIRATRQTVEQNLAAWLMSDANELVQVRRVCCRFCYGTDHLYQETPSERHARKQAYDQAKIKAGDNWHKLGPLDELGGVGYDRRKAPVEECPECWGEGIEHVHIADTRKLSKAGALSYAGLKVTTAGIEVKLQDKAKALEMIGRNLGMFGAADDEEKGVRTIRLINDPDAD